MGVKPSKQKKRSRDANYDPFVNLLPVHLKPKHDELTSSWLIRLAIAHAMEPDAFYSVIYPKKKKIPIDIDETRDERILWLLVRITGAPLDKVKATTLQLYEDNLNFYGSFGRIVPRDMSRQWIMPINNQSSTSQFGLQFCPYCLFEDEAPYFRRRWRLAFITLCGTHRVLLLDRCTRCGLPIDIKSNASKSRKKRWTSTMTWCYSCDFDIRTATSSAPSRDTFPSELEFQEGLLNAFNKNAVTTPKGKIHYVSSLFNTLHFLTRLIALNGFGKVIRTQFCKYYEIPTFSITSTEKYRRIEMLNVRDRFRLLRIAGRVLEEWPDDLLSFL